MFLGRCGFIGKYLATLTPDQEDRVLTQAFEPLVREVRMRNGLPMLHRHQCGCLVMTAEQAKIWAPNTDLAAVAGHRYESACDRFGVERVNRAIRNRVLRNMARRTVPVPVEEVVV